MCKMEFPSFSRWSQLGPFLPFLITKHFDILASTPADSANLSSVFPASQLGPRHWLENPPQTPWTHRSPHPLLEVAGHLCVSFSVNISPAESVSLLAFLCFFLSDPSDFCPLLFLQAPTLLCCSPPPTPSLSLGLSLFLSPEPPVLSAFLSIISLAPSFYSQAPWGEKGGSKTRRTPSSQRAENGPIKATRLLRQQNQEEAKIAPGGPSWKDKQRKREKGQNEGRVPSPQDSWLDRRWEGAAASHPNPGCGSG